MRRFTTPEEVRLARLPPAVISALEQALATELQLAGPEDYDHDNNGSIWLVEKTDTDASMAPLRDAAKDTSRVRANWLVVSDRGGKGLTDLCH